MWTRRDALRAGMASWLLAGLSGAPLTRAARASDPGRAGPRYVVVLFLRGGMDAIYTTDPKERAEVDPRVDIPYAPDEITEAGAHLFGPHFLPLARHANKLALVKGLQVRTANHESGALQMLRLRTAVTYTMPSILEIVGSRRDGQPLANVTLGDVSSLEYSPASLVASTADTDKSLFDAIDAVDPGDFELLEQVFAAHVQAVERWPSGAERARTEEHLDQVRALFGRLGQVPRFQSQRWGSFKADYPMSQDLQRTLWLLENDLTRCVYVKLYMPWDSHYDNARKQSLSNTNFVAVFGQFLTELAQRRNAHGALADNTLIVAGSELGRFPILNGNDGKDHFPETTVMWSGPGVAAGASFGQTGPMMEGSPISLKTGRPTDTGGVSLALDDIGTTLLHMTGFDPELYGYRGNRLRFLEQA